MSFVGFDLATALDITLAVFAVGYILRTALFGRELEFDLNSIIGTELPKRSLLNQVVSDREHLLAA